MEDVRVRDARADDAEAIATVHVESWQAVYRGIVDDDILEGLSVEQRAERWRSLFASGAESATFVAEIDRRIVGFVDVGPARDTDATEATGEVRAIYVSADAWDQGIGAALMRRGLEALRGRFTEAVLWVLEDNERGRRFYEKGSWVPDGTSQALEGLRGLVEVRYRINL